MIEHTRQARVPPLRLTADVIHYIRFAVVVVDVEMLRLEDLEVEVFPLDFVPAEVLSVCRGCEKDEEEEDDYRFTHRDHLEDLYCDRQFGGPLQVRCPADATPVELDALKALADSKQRLRVQHLER